MKLLILLVLVTIANASSINQNDCNGVNVNGINYDQEILKDNINPFQMTLDYTTNNLYFSFDTNKESWLNDAVSVGYLNLKTNESGTISGVNYGYANGVDQKSHDVYFGGVYGLYKLNKDSTIASHLQIETENDVSQLFPKDGVYFTTSLGETAYLYKNSKIKEVAELNNTSVLRIALDKANNIFFSNHSGLFFYTKQDGIKKHIGVDLNNEWVRVFTSDVNGKLYFTTPEGIFDIDEETHVVRMLATLTQIWGLAIDSDGSFICGFRNKIVRLRSTGKKCVT